ncbi:YbhB/YbcL family Raf kinase inhibitor-like protein [Mucilaginibacter inviolabilis]|uniref:YbhB/YbcL family Raf kinase inhibitor-like protein n=1 Tax=Mucilaginibacter inviolabilis TaxID=2714892 RepID=UPI001931E2B2|nr:YbhB/YbcL family Raf kinase inhibitor-like protein [Mucilaginibacter inviolabilis]
MKTFISFALVISLGSIVNAQTFTLKSADLGGQFSNQFVANTFGCSGGNKSPQLEWQNAPAGTQSFAVTMYDPQAPTGSGWWHWVIFDIPANVHELKQGAGNPSAGIAPAGSVQGLTDALIPGYSGPCPPENDAAHSYVITVYALKSAKLGVDNKVSAALTGFMLNQNVIAKASLIVYYKR